MAGVRPSSSTLSSRAIDYGHDGGRRSPSLAPNAARSYPPPNGMEIIPWYHSNISRHVAESLLMSTAEDGSYLLRDSNKNPGDFTLSVRAKNAVKHFNVHWNGREFCFGFGKFASVDTLLEHFDGKPVIGGEGGVLTTLKSEWHAEWGQVPDGQDTAKPTVFSIGSKEGYLTKLGFHRKNWLTRWFVLYKNELKYYKNREEKMPLKVIDVSDIKDVIVDNTQGKENCFKLLTSNRTYFMVASSSKEAEEWIEILQWKLKHTGSKEEEGAQK
eukprot:Em0002g294a